MPKIQKITGDEGRVMARRQVHLPGEQIDTAIAAPATNLSGALAPEPYASNDADRHGAILGIEIIGGVGTTVITGLTPVSPDNSCFSAEYQVVSVVRLRQCTEIECDIAILR
ncbi:MAG: hypothetical protein KDE32_05470 [Novosphingobium sp.]|nr:hypothetical protein [Novosphingobium sp.]